MKCDCGSGTNVKDARYIAEGYWRKRSCPSCGSVFTSIEQRCETVNGHKGTQPQYTVPKPPTVRAPLSRARRRAVPPPPVPKGNKKPVTTPTVVNTAQPARRRVEDLKMERYLDSL